MEINIYKRRDATVEAVQITARNISDVAEWCGATQHENLNLGPYLRLGYKDGFVYDYAVRETNGRFYIVESDRFVSSYASVLPRIGRK